MMSKAQFVKLLRESTITQAYITGCVVTTCCVMWAMGNPIPEALQTILIIVVGFFFGSKAANLSKKEQ